MTTQNKSIIMDKLALIFSIIGLLLICVVIGIIPAVIGFILSIICLAQGQKYNKKLALSSLIISLISGTLFVIILICVPSPDANNNIVTDANSVLSTIPSAEPTTAPTTEPTATPTTEPTVAPTAEPTAAPTAEPTAAPTAEPTATPTTEPTATPTAEPTATPTAEPTVAPTIKPTIVPTTEPTVAPTAEPTAITTDTSNNFDTYDNPQQQQTNDTYVLNTSSMKIHYPHCKSVSKIAPHNYSTSSESLETLKANGYTTCGICFK